MNFPEKGYQRGRTRKKVCVACAIACSVAVVIVAVAVVVVLLIGDANTGVTSAIFGTASSAVQIASSAILDSTNLTDTRGIYPLDFVCYEVTRNETKVLFVIIDNVALC